MTARAALTFLQRATAPVAVLVAMQAAPGVTRADSYGTELPFAAGSGARASALGLAASGLAGEPSAQQYNPATLSLLQYKKLELYRTTFFDSQSLYHSVSYGHPLLNYGTLGATVLRLDVGGIEERDENNILLSPDLKNSQTRLLLGYAVPLRRSLSAGLNLKIDNQSFGSFSGSGVGLDVGVLATRFFSGDLPFHYMRGSFAILNLLEPSVKLDQDDVSDPMSVVFGASTEATAGRIAFVTLLDFVAPRYSPFTFRFGQEVTYGDVLAFRFGFDGATPTVGGGVAWRNASVDYAYRSSDLGSNHRVSVTVRFGSSLDERRESERAALEAQLDRQLNSKMSELESSQLALTVARADSLFDTGRYDDAATQYELALLWDAGNEKSRGRIKACRYYEAMKQAQDMIEARNYLEALYHLRRALSYSPGDPEATSMLAECNRQIRVQTDHTEMINRMMKRSIDLYANRSFVEANAGFREILNLDPGNRLAQEYEKKSYTNIQNQKQQAIVEANGLADRGDFTAAVAAMERALRLDPDDGYVRDRIAELQSKRADAKRRRETPRPRPAVPAPRPVVNPVDDSVIEPKYQEGLGRFEQGDFDAAVRLLHEVWLADPRYRNVTELLAKAYLLIGMEKYSQEKYREAIVIWERALAVDPGNVKAQRYLLKAKEEASRLSSVENGQ